MVAIHCCSQSIDVGVGGGGGEKSEKSENGGDVGSGGGYGDTDDDHSCISSKSCCCCIHHGMAMRDGGGGGGMVEEVIVGAGGGSCCDADCYMVQSWQCMDGAGAGGVAVLLWHSGDCGLYGSLESDGLHADDDGHVGIDCGWDGCIGHCG